MSMTVMVQLCGGLGNQCFMYAAALSVVGQGNEDQIVADCSLLEAYQNTPGITPRPFQLDYLGVRPGASNEPCDALHQESVPADYDADRSYRLQGYFQDLRYWKPWVREWFQEKLEPFPHCRETVCVHVRRGDYVSNPSATAWHGVLPAAYYTTAIEELAEDRGIENVSLFSDDPQWCIDTLIPKIDLPTSISSQSDPWSDIAQMAACSSHVIANSTFSWLGAYLANSEQVIYPKNWLSGGRSGPPIFPENWQAR